MKKYKPVDFNHIIPLVKGIDSSLFKMHFKLYEGLTDGTNSVVKELNKLKKNDLAYGSLKERFAFFYNGMKLHELFFEQFRYNKNIKIPSNFSKEIKKHFGTFDKWIKDFKKTGEIVDIGFVALVRDRTNGNLMNIFISEFQTGDFIDCDYILVMDIWEHAYITQFGLDIKKYISTFFNNIDWNIISDRLELSFEK